MHRRYLTADVFTDQAFVGNPLAIVLDAADLSTAQMQLIAREFKYAETTFVLPPIDAEHTARVRIFSPGAELPFAGHPNIGTAFALARLARREGRDLGPVVRFEEGAGLVPVALLEEDGQIVGAELTAPEPLSLRSTVAVDDVATCLSLSREDMETVRHQPQVVSVGLPFLVAELASRDALRRAAGRTGSRHCFRSTTRTPSIATRTTSRRMRGRWTGRPGCSRRSTGRARIRRLAAPPSPRPPCSRTSRPGPLATSRGASGRATTSAGRACCCRVSRSAVVESSVRGSADAASR